MDTTDGNPGQTPLVSESGIAARHPSIADPPASVAPTASGGNGFNTLRILVAPVACWRVEDLCFDFGSSFPGPRIRPGMQHLAQLLRAHPPPSLAARGQPPEAAGCPLSVFAHADPVGEDDDNKQLSGRRAVAIYGLLTHDAELWDRLFTQPFRKDDWGRPVLQAMLDTVEPAGAEPRDPAHIEHDGVQRRDLFGQYMQALWPAEHRLHKEDFLARGADPGGKGDYQGCGEFNPLLLLSQQEDDAFRQQQDKTERNHINAPNRRVMVLIYRKGSRVDPALWPCPRVKEGPAGCRKRFWADGEARRSGRLPDARRQYEVTRDTLGCRFYDRMVGRSPCERALKTTQIRLYDPDSRAIPHAPCEIVIEGHQPFTTTASAEGIVVVRNIEVPAVCRVRWGHPRSDGKPLQYVYGLTMFLAIGDDDDHEEARKKLNNLGYGLPAQEANIAAFQRDYRSLVDPPLSATGELDERTLRVLREVYGRCEHDLRRTRID